jgi:hypothetical protein
MQVRLDGSHDLAVNLQRVEEGVAIHIIRYGYDETADAVPMLDALEMSVRLPEAFDAVRCVDPCGTLTAELSRDGEVHTLSLSNVPLYGIVLLHRA